MIKPLVLVSMGRRTPYSDRNDLERLASSWTKLEGFMARGEWSAAVVRAATAAEIAANIAVRQELETKRGLEKAFVDSLLKWANALDGKLNPFKWRSTHEFGLQALYASGSTLALPGRSASERLQIAPAAEGHGRNCTADHWTRWPRSGPTDIEDHPRR